MRTLWLLTALLSAVATRPAAAADLAATPANGRIVVHVLKKGLFSSFAHDHHFEVTEWRATANVPDGDPAGMSVQAVLAAGSLRDRQEALSEADRAKVDAQAAGPEVLDAARYPEITWRAEGARLEPGATTDGHLRGTVRGWLTLRGQTHPVEVKFDAEREGEGWRVSGKGRTRQSDFGITPFSGFLGTVGVEDEIEIEVALSLTRGGSAPPAGGVPATPPEKGTPSPPDGGG